MSMIPSAGLKAYGLELGFDSVGICAPDPPVHFEAYRRWIDKGFHGTMDYLARHVEPKRDPACLLPGVRSIIAVTLNYNQPNPMQDGMPRIARYALGRDYHKVLKGKLGHMTQWIEANYGGAPSIVCVDAIPIMERDYAQAAGLGWFGKNTMLIDSRRGSWFFIGLLLTTLEFERDSTAVGGCGDCTRCIEACPTGAIVFEDAHWQVDARRCISYLTIEHRGEIEIDTAGWTFGCDICQEVCPFNTPRSSQPLRANPTRKPDFLVHRKWPSLERLRVIGYGEWDELTRGSSVRRAGFEGLRRNAELASATLTPWQPSSPLPDGT